MARGRCTDAASERARREKIAAARKGRTLSDATRRRMSIAQSVRRALEAEDRLDGFIEWFDHDLGLNELDGKRR